jgi:hypothetical protein
MESGALEETACPLVNGVVTFLHDCCEDLNMKVGVDHGMIAPV